MRGLCIAAATFAVALSASSLAFAQDSTATGRCAENEGQRSADPWGLLSLMAGRYYWFEDPKLKSHTAYLYVHWITEGQVLAGVTYYGKHVLAADEYVLDPANGKVLLVANTSNVEYWGIVRRVGACLSLYTYVQDKPVRTLLAPAEGGSFAGHTDSYKDGAWQSAGDDHYVATTLDELKAAGLTKGR